MADINFTGDDRFKCGATNHMSFGFANLTDPDDPESVLIPDTEYLVGKTARMQVRWKVADELPLFEATTEDGKIVIDAAEGRIEITIPPGDTELLTFKEKVGWYDLELVDGADVQRPIEGTILFDPNVTRAEA
jgi:hypothetical protein